MREIKISYMWQDGDNWIERIYNLSQIEAGDHYDDMRDNPLLKGYSTMARRQFTGLKDKNGKECYEGDIVIFPNGIGADKLQIVFYMGAFNIAFLNGTISQPLWPFIVNDPFEIIGNVYENPELIDNGR